MRKGVEVGVWRIGLEGSLLSRMCSEADEEEVDLLSDEHPDHG